MQRIFKHSDIQNTIIALDKEPSIFIHRKLSYLIICKSYRGLEMVKFFCLTLYNIYNLFCTDMTGFCTLHQMTLELLEWPKYKTAKPLLYSVHGVQN